MTPTTAEDAVLRRPVVTTEIETPEWAQPRDWPPPDEAAPRRDEHQDTARTPKLSDLKFFVFSVGITGQMSCARSRAGARRLQLMLGLTVLPNRAIGRTLPIPRINQLVLVLRMPLPHDTVLATQTAIQLVAVRDSIVC